MKYKTNRTVNDFMLDSKIADKNFETIHTLPPNIESQAQSRKIQIKWKKKRSSML